MIFIINFYLFIVNIFFRKKQYLFNFFIYDFSKKCFQCLRYHKRDFYQCFSKKHFYTYHKNTFLIDHTLNIPHQMYNYSYIDYI